MSPRTQWRFMWKHAKGDEVGAQWRDEKPTDEEFIEWLVDFLPGAFWVEKRAVLEYPPERDWSFDHLRPKEPSS